MNGILTTTSASESFTLKSYFVLLNDRIGFFASIPFSSTTETANPPVNNSDAGIVIILLEEFHFVKSLLLVSAIFLLAQYIFNSPFMFKDMLPSLSFEFNNFLPSVL